MSVLCMLIFLMCSVAEVFETDHLILPCRACGGAQEYRWLDIRLVEWQLTMV